MELQFLVLCLLIELVRLRQEFPTQLFCNQNGLVEDRADDHQAEQLLLLLRVGHVYLVARILVQVQTEFLPSLRHFGGRSKYLALRIINNLLESVAQALQDLTFLLELIVFIRLLLRIFLIDGILLKVDSLQLKLPFCISSLKRVFLAGDLAIVRECFGFLIFGVLPQSLPIALNHSILSDKCEVSQAFGSLKDLFVDRVS